MRRLTAPDPDAIALELSWAELWHVREMLLVGLSAYGEIERLQEIGEALRAGGSVPESMQPIDPTGDAATVSKFADALRYLQEVNHE